MWKREWVYDIYCIKLFILKPLLDVGEEEKKKKAKDITGLFVYSSEKQGTVVIT